MDLRFSSALALVSVFCIGVSGCGSEPSPWNAQSVHLATTCGSFFGGAMHYEAERSQLTDEQLRLLAALQPIDSNSACPEDTMSCSLSIMQTGGSVADDSSFEMDQGCGKPHLISFASFDPFRKSLGCQYSKDAKFPPLALDPKCFNGVIVVDQRPIERTLRVDDQSTHHVELSGCAGMNQLGRIHFTVSAPDGSPVGEGAPATALNAKDTCLALDADFSTAGDYQLEITVDPGFLPLGDIFLRFF